MNASTVAGPPIPALNGAWTGETEEPEQTFVADADAWLLSVAPEKREERLAVFLATELARALGVSVDDVDPDALFVSMGMDSLMAIELRSRLQSAMGMPISASALIYNYPNITALTAGLLAMWTQHRGESGALLPASETGEDAEDGDDESGAWVIPPRLDVEDEVPLVCFPFAGGGASMFHPWRASLEPAVGVYAVQLPGHENRFGEPFITSIDEINDLVSPIAPLLEDRSYVLFGHSMGAAAAFEVARRLRRMGAPLPLALIVSSFPPPDANNRIPPLARLPMDEAIEKMLAYFPGIPDAVLQDRELLETAVRILQADMLLLESYRYEAEAPLECPIYAFGGSDDPWVSGDELEGWRLHTSGEFSVTQFPGDHFYFRTPENLTALLARVRELCLGSTIRT
ncbi:MAG: alpha/beta fold hydrolase [Dehalococcoidia bacterium]